MAIKRTRLADEVYQTVASLIAEGKFTAGARLDEIGLCRTLEVSRTPLREALVRLQAEGFVTSLPNRGHFVTGLSAQGVEENYPIIAALDALALRSSPLPTEARLRGLKRLNRAMGKTGLDAPVLYQLDLDFHQRLIEACPNQGLLTLIAQLKQKIRRFDGSWKRGLANQALAVKEHAAIIAALEHGENARAATLLEKHWQGGIQTVLGWVKAQTRAED